MRLNMKNLLWVIVSVIVMSSCAGGKSGQKMSHKKSSNANMIASKNQGANKKVRASYRSNKYHQSKKHAVKSDDVVVDKSLANALKAKKVNQKNSDKYKKSQASYLQRLNSKGNNSKKNIGYFSFY